MPPVFAGKLVRGYGRAEKIETRLPQPVQVELVNTGPMALAETVQKLFESQAKAQADSRPDDLVTTEIAVEQLVSEATIRCKIKAGELRDYRPADAEERQAITRGAPFRPQEVNPCQPRLSAQRVVIVRPSGGSRHQALSRLKSRPKSAL